MKNLRYEGATGRRSSQIVKPTKNKRFSKDGLYQKAIERLEKEKYHIVPYKGETPNIFLFGEHEADDLQESKLQKDVAKELETKCILHERFRNYILNMRCIKRLEENPDFSTEFGAHEVYLWLHKEHSKRQPNREFQEWLKESLIASDLHEYEMFYFGHADFQSNLRIHLTNVLKPIELIVGCGFPYLQMKQMEEEYNLKTGDFYSMIDSRIRDIKEKRILEFLEEYSQDKDYLVSIIDGKYLEDGSEFLQKLGEEKVNPLIIDQNKKVVYKHKSQKE